MSREARRRTHEAETCNQQVGSRHLSGTNIFDAVPRPVASSEAGLTLFGGRAHA